MPLFKRKRETIAPIEAQTFAHSQPVWTPSHYSGTYAGTSVNDWSALGLPAFWRGINLLCDHVASLPFHAYRNNVRIPTQPLLLEEPSPGETLYDVYFQIAWSLVLRGNAYAYLSDFTNLGYPRSLLVLNPDSVSVRQNDEGEIEYRILGELVPSAFILHVRGHRPAGSVVGVGVLAAQREGLAHAIALNEYSGRYFGDSAMPSGVIEVDGQLGNEDATRLKVEWIAAQGGRHRYPAVLSAGMKFSPLSVSPEEQQLLESRQFSLLEIALMLGIPPRWLGASSDAFMYSNLDAENASLIQFGLRPWTTRIEQALTKLLPKPQYVRANFDALLRADTKARYEAHGLALAAGFMTVDEIRELEELPPLPEEEEEATPLPPIEDEDTNDED